LPLTVRKLWSTCVPEKDHLLSFSIAGLSLLKLFDRLVINGGKVFVQATLAPFQSLSNWPVRMKFNFIYGLWIANRTPSYTTADDIKVPTQLWLLMVIVLGFKVVKRTVVD
ncbi:hypothetical protein T4E_7783, partial [Trichinella pseudospiralis]